MVRLSYLLFAAIIFSGCAGDTVKPGWKYRDSRYITATGSGQSDIEAANQAAGGVSRIFEPQVTRSTYDRVKSVVDTSGVEVPGIEPLVREKSRTPIRGIAIVKMRFNKDNGVYYALAVLNKKRARNDWIGELKDLDGFIKTRLNALNSVQSRFIKLTSLHKIFDLWIQREVIVSRLNVIGHDGEAPADYDIKPVLQKTQEIKAVMPVFVDISGVEHTGTVNDKVSEALLQAGFTLTDTRTEADVLITGTVNVKSLELVEAGQVFIRATVSLTVKDLQTGRIVGKISEGERTGHVSYDEAVYKALIEISPVVADNLIHLLEGVQ